MGACAKIDLGRLRARLSAEQGRELSLPDVHAWLSARGFTLTGDWHCDSSALGLLHPDEVTAVRTTETIDHVTYSTGDPPP